MASVPEATPSAYFTPQYAANSCSKAARFAPFNNRIEEKIRSHSRCRSGAISLYLRVRSRSGIFFGCCIIRSAGIFSILFSDPPNSACFDNVPRRDTAFEAMLNFLSATRFGRSRTLLTCNGQNPPVRNPPVVIQNDEKKVAVFTKERSSLIDTLWSLHPWAIRFSPSLMKEQHSYRRDEKHWLQNL